MRAPRDPLLIVVLAAICLLVPPAVDRLDPPTTGRTLTVTLSRGGAQVGGGGAGAPDGPSIRARLLESGQAGLDIDPDGPFPMRRERMRFEFELPEGGRYSLHGIAQNRISRPVELSVNGRVVSRVAFRQVTGPEPEAHRIATRVRLREGSNEVSLTGGDLKQRSLSLELREEAPPSPIRLLLWLAAAAALSLVGYRATRSLRLSARARLAGVCALTGLLGIGSLAALARVDGAQLVELGRKNPELYRRIEAFEAYLASERWEQARRDRFTVAVFGDSTHYLSLEEDRTLLPAMRRALPEGRREEIEILGMSAGGMGAWDYYLLLNRMVREPPDLVVLPVNGSSFSRGWMRNRGYWFHTLERYLTVRELPAALRLDVAGRSFEPGRLLRQWLDDLIFGGRAAPFLRGVKIYAEEETARLSAAGLRLGQSSLPPIPDETARPRSEDADWATADVPPDHPLFAVYDRINALARRHGIRVLYYNVGEQSLESGGVGPITPERDVRAILDRIGGAPGVSALRLPPGFPEGEFMDRWIHMTPRGIDALAERLVTEILRLEIPPVESRSPRSLRLPGRIAAAAEVIEP